MQFTPRQLETTLRLARHEAATESAERLAFDRLAQHGDAKAIDKAMRDLQSDKAWRQR